MEETKKRSQTPDAANSPSEKTKKMQKATTSSSPSSPFSPAKSPVNIPSDLLFSYIFPSLPAKLLFRFQIVCKQWRSALFPPNPAFARAQSRCQSHISSGVVYADGDRRIAFLPTNGSPVGVPDPTVCKDGEDVKFELVASTHGLLCLRVDNYSLDRRYLVVYNPVMRDRNELKLNLDKPELPFGLAFDPSTSPDHYTVVQLQEDTFHSHHGRRTRYRFETYSSDTRVHRVSNQTVTVTSEHLIFHRKAVFARGVLYWLSYDFMIFFDPEKDVGGFMMLPKQMVREMLLQFAGELGVWKERVTCTLVRDFGVKVWVMAKPGRWEIRHVMEVDTMLKENPDVQYCHPMLEIYWSNWEILRLICKIRVLPYEGGHSLYLRLYPDNEQELILRCNMETKKMEVFKKSNLGKRTCEQPFFCYHNSLVALPHKVVLKK